MGGDHCFLYGGNSRLIKSLCKNIPIFYGKIVEKVEYNENGVKVYVSKNNKSEVFEGDMVLCTVPLGVLKKRVIKFDPELPGRKIEAIERLGFGLLNKVAMLFPYVFWGEEIDTFGGLNEYTETRGEFFLFYSYHTVSGGAVLVSLVAGEAARVFESTDPKVSVNRVLNVLKGIYGRKGIEIPDPIQSICTRWGEDPFSYGSYSHVRVQSSGSDYDILGESVANRLFFAGEATTRQYPATMHGAYLIGLREASNILRTTKAKQQLQLYPKKSSLKFDVLVDLFKRPDFEDEEFEFVFDSSNEGIESMGIVKYSVDESLCVYAVLTRGQGDELMEVSGGKEMKLECVRRLGLKFMGGNGLVVQGSALIAQLARARKGRGRAR